MTRHAKVFRRLLSRPTDFTWGELRTLLSSLGYETRSGSGSSRKFIHPQSKATLMLHEPHPGKILKAYQVREVIAFLKQEKHIDE